MSHHAREEEFRNGQAGTLNRRIDDENLKEDPGSLSVGEAFASSDSVVSEAFPLHIDGLNPAALSGPKSKAPGFAGWILTLRLPTAALATARADQRTQSSYPTG